MENNTFLSLPLSLLLNNSAEWQCSICVCRRKYFFHMYFLWSHQIYSLHAFVFAEESRIFVKFQFKQYFTYQSSFEKNFNYVWHWTKIALYLSERFWRTSVEMYLLRLAGWSILLFEMFFADSISTVLQHPSKPYLSHGKIFLPKITISKCNFFVVISAYSFCLKRVWMFFTWQFKVLLL